MSLDNGEMLQNSSENQSCGDYFELVKARDELQTECMAKLDQIDELTAENEDSCVNLADKIKNVYQDYVSELTDKLNFLELIIGDLTEEMSQQKEKVHLSEKTINVQQVMLNNVEQERSEKEAELNKAIEKVEMKFIAKCDQLFDIKSEFEKTQEELKHSKKTKKKLEVEVDKANFELYRYLCKFKAQKETIFNSASPKVTQAMVDELAWENEQINKIMTEEEESMRSIREQIFDCKNEIKSTRSKALSQHRIATQHNDWKNEQLCKQINFLEDEIRKCKELASQQDPELKELRSSLELMRIDCIDAEKVLSNLQKSMDELEEESFFNCDDFEEESDSEQTESFASEPAAQIQMD